jgi:hypothetical protein
MTSAFDENLRASPGVIRIARSEIRELRYRVLLGGIHLALEEGRDTDTFLFSVNSASFTAARGFLDQFDDPGIIYGTLRDLGVPDGYIEAEGLEGAIRRIASWIHPSKIIEDEYPENYPDPNALLACAAELKGKFPSLTEGNEKRIIRLIEKVIPLGLPFDIRQKLRAYLE